MDVGGKATVAMRLYLFLLPNGPGTGGGDGQPDTEGGKDRFDRLAGQEYRRDRQREVLYASRGGTMDMLVRLSK